MSNGAPAGQVTSLDSGGNPLLNGTYYFREVIYRPGSASALKQAVAAYGNIAFDGHGNYTVSAMVNDSSQPGPSALTTKGTYTISASGYGYLTHPLSGADLIYGLAAQITPFQPAIFVGSATETVNNFNDVFIAVPLSAAQPTVATLNGTYSVAYLNFPLTSTSPNSFDPASAYNAFFQMTADGMGNISAVNITGNEGMNVKFTTSEAAFNYSFSNGAGILKFTNAMPTQLQNIQVTVPIEGPEYLYISPDGNFVFGGSPYLWDMFVGVRYPGSSNFGGLYYEAGLDEDLSQFGGTTKLAKLNSYFGAFNASNSLVVGDQRILPSTTKTPFHSTYATAYTVNADGTSSDSTTAYVTGAGGAIRIGYGTAPHLALKVSVQAPTFSGAGVYLNPTGVVNAASFAPFTAGIAPGEFVALFGSSLSTGPAQTASGLTFPTSLNNVQVNIGGLAAQIYYVSPTEVLAVVPSTVQGPFAQIQLVNNGVMSNAISQPVNMTDPGVFLEPFGGTLFGAILHQNSSNLVTSSSPARAGEIVSVYATGLGSLNAGLTLSPITASMGGLAATVTYSGVAPGLAGVYQLNIQVPSGLPSGNASLAIVGPDSATSEAVIPVASSN